MVEIQETLNLDSKNTKQLHKTLRLNWKIWAAYKRNVSGMFYQLLFHIHKR